MTVDPTQPETKRSKEKETDLRSMTGVTGVTTGEVISLKVEKTQASEDGSIDGPSKEKTQGTVETEDIAFPSNIMGSKSLVSCRENSFEDAKGEYSNPDIRWYEINWRNVIFTACLLTTAINPMQLEMLSQHARSYGGLFFLVMYFFLVISVQLPLTFLMIHVAQYTSVGTTSIFSMFGSVFRAFGWGVFCFVVLHQAILVNEGAKRTGYALSMAPQAHIAFTCKLRDFDYDTNFDVNERCSSLTDQIQCDKGNIEYCKDNLPNFLNNKLVGHNYEMEIEGIHFTYPASWFFTKTNSLKYDFDVGDWHCAMATVSILIAAAFASLGPTILAAFVTSAGVVTFLLIIIVTSYISSLGDLSVGWYRLWTLSQVKRFFNYGIFSAIFDVVVAPIGLNFPLVCMASYRRRLSDSYTVACVIVILQTLIFILFFVANIAMFGISEKTGVELNIPTSIPSLQLFGRVFKLNNDYWDAYLPEFFGAFGEPWIYQLFAITTYMMYYIGIMGPFFTVLALARDYKLRRPQISPRLLVVLLTGVQFLFLALLEVYPEIADTMRNPSFVGCFIIAFVLITVRVYGSNELEVDLCTMYPITGTVRDYIGPLSPLLTFSMNTFTPIFLTVVVAIRISFQYGVDSQSEGYTFGQFLKMILPPMPMFTFIAVFSFYIGGCAVRYRDPLSRRQMWQIFYPSHQHPSYNRIIRTYFIEEEIKKGTSSERPSAE